MPSGPFPSGISLLPAQRSGQQPATRVSYVRRSSVQRSDSARILESLMGGGKSRMLARLPRCASSAHHPYRQDPHLCKAVWD